MNIKEIEMTGPISTLMLDWRWFNIPHMPLIHMSWAMRKCDISYANNKGADQPAHPRRLISTFISCCLDSIISLDSISEISSL